MRQTTREKLDLNIPLTSRNILVEMVARAGIEPATFRFSGGAQRFLPVFSVISPHFRPRRNRPTADDYRTEMTRRFAVWNEVTGLTAAA
jgi:hypothetical protein